MRAAILTFHNTPNYGATLQCYALSRRLGQLGAEVEVINYSPPRALFQYGKFLLLGRRRSLHHFQRIQRFRSFLKTRLKLSGAPIFKADKLKSLNDRYDVAFVGSDEVWKVDHMRNFDTAFYFDFLDPARTRLCAYAASSSTVTNLRDHAASVSPLLERFSGFGIRDTSTASAVADLTGREVTPVLDPTLVWDFESEDLPPIHPRPYIAVYSWPDESEMTSIRAFADREGLEVVCIGCHHRQADANYIGIGPTEWMQLVKHSSAVLTDFFHGILFSLIFRRPFFAHVNPAKRMKLEQALDWVGLRSFLHDTPAIPADMRLADITPDWDAVETLLGPRRSASIDYLQAHLDAAQAN